MRTHTGYESGSKSLSILTPLRRALGIYQVFTNENISFAPATCHTTYPAEQHPEHSPKGFRSHNPVCHHLVFTNSDEESPYRTHDP